MATIIRPNPSSDPSPSGTMSAKARNPVNGTCARCAMRTRTMRASSLSGGCTRPGFIQQLAHFEAARRRHRMTYTLPDRTYGCPCRMANNNCALTKYPPRSTGITSGGSSIFPPVEMSCYRSMTSPWMSPESPYFLPKTAIGVSTGY